MALRAQGPDRRHQDGPLRGPGVDAGRARRRGGHAGRHPGDGRFRHRPTRQRPLAELLTKKLRPGDIYTHVLLGPPRRADRSGKPNPGMIAGAGAGVIFDVGHGGGSFVWRVAVPIDEGGLPARLDLDRPAHRQHERRHEGHAQRDEQVPGDGHVARRGDPPLHLEPGARDPAGRNSATSRSGAVADVAVLRLEKGQFGFLDVYGARLAGTERLVAR